MIGRELLNTLTYLIPDGNFIPLRFSPKSRFAKTSLQDKPYSIAVGLGDTLENWLNLLHPVPKNSTPDKYITQNKYNAKPGYVYTAEEILWEKAGRSNTMFIYELSSLKFVRLLYYPF